MSKFRVGQRVYVADSAPKSKIGALYKTFTTIASVVQEVKGNIVTLRLMNYTIDVPIKWVRTYHHKINVELERIKWERANAGKGIQSYSVR